MIQTKEDLRLYLEKDKQALGITRKRPCLVGDDIWKFEIALRYYEYLTNVNGGGVTRLIRRKFWGFLHHYFGIRLGFSIPINVFDYGLRINHYGTIVVNTKARIGKWCDIHACVNIGESLDKKAPCLGDNCWIGPGAKLFGGITIGNGVMIGAGSVVNKSFTENNITIVGVPARKIKDTGDPYHRV